MFLHLFTYRLRVLLRDKETIFWTLLFPIALSLFFFMALSGLKNVGQFQVIPIAVVEETPNPGLDTLLESLAQGEDPLFSLRRVSMSEAQELLDESKVSGILTVQETPSMKVNTSGLSQSIVKAFLDEYNQTGSTVRRILEINPTAATQIGSILADRREYTLDQPIGSGGYSMVLGYYYALIAMTCFYGGFLGMTEVNQIQANLSKRAARINIAPVHKMKAFLANLSASILILFVEISLFLSFLMFVLDIDFGPKTLLVILTTGLGALTGLSFGAFLSAVLKTGENVKNGIFVGVTMLGSFLSGLMFGDMKFLVQTKAPLLSLLNPVNLLADSYYALYVYDDLTRFVQNLSGLAGFALFFSLGTYLIIRRRRYASV